MLYTCRYQLPALLAAGYPLLYTCRYQLPALLAAGYPLLYTCRYQLPALLAAGYPLRYYGLYHPPLPTTGCCAFLALHLPLHQAGPRDKPLLPGAGYTGYAGGQQQAVHQQAAPCFTPAVTSRLNKSPLAGPLPGRITPTDSLYTCRVALHLPHVPHGTRLRSPA